MIKKRFISMLVLLAAVATGAWADETPLVTIESKDYTSFKSGSKTFDDKVTVTFSKSVYNNGDEDGWYTFDEGSLLTVAGTNGYTITSCKFYTEYGPANTGYTVKGESPSVYLNYGEVYTDNSESVYIGNQGIKKIEVYGYETPATVAVTGVTLAPTSATLTLGETETVTLIPTVLPAEATDKSVTWSSSDEAVATVTDGVVTAVAAGTATITVTTTDGAKTATCAVTVAAPAASTYTVTLKEGTEDATSWTIAPAEATTTGVAAGTTVTATYNGMKKVKSVKAKKKAAAPAEETYKIEGVKPNNDAFNVAEAATLPFTKKVKELFADLAAYAEQISIDNITVSGNVEMGTLAGWDTEITFTGEGTGQITVSYNFSGLPGQPVTTSFTVTKN